ESAALGDVFREHFVDRRSLETFVEVTAAAANGDGLIVFALPLNLDVFEFALTTEEFDETIEVSGVAKNTCTKIGFDEFAAIRVSQHPLECRIDAEKFAVDGGAVDSVGSAFDKRAEAGFRLAERFRCVFAVRNVAADDHEFFGHAFWTEDDA